MYVLDHFRGQGIATKILGQLELWAEELGYQKCILETGNRQLSAIALYKKNGYEVIDNYDQYKGVANSVCFGKGLL
jgi:GNAT superfamily N-acetyltransferase